MGENPLISDGKRHPSPLMENANNLSKNFDASVKKIRPPPLPHWLGVRRHFERFSTRGQRTTVQNERSEKKKQREKESK
jgi:hypothetical protein